MNSVPAEEKRSVNVCIIGMHRSGTSMIARSLAICGLNLGPEQDLLGPDNGNPLGHFENKRILKLNESLLAHLGGSTDNPPRLQANWQYDQSLDVFYGEAKSILETFAGAGLWGWKEPRTTLLIPFWRRLLDHPRFVICLRNPLEVARSIADRDRIPLEKGFYLWNQYTRAAIRDSEGCPRIVTFYEDHFTNGLAELKRVAAFCGLGVLLQARGLEEAVSRDLRHQACTSLELLTCSDAPAEYKLLYLGLREISSQTSRCVVRSAAEDDLPATTGAFLRLMDEFHQQEVAKTQELLLKATYELIELRSVLNRKENELQRYAVENARLQQFGDAVKKTLVYRLYHRFIKPLKRYQVG